MICLLFISALSGTVSWAILSYFLARRARRCSASKESAELLVRCKREDDLFLAGDPEGVYGQFPPFCGPFTPLPKAKDPEPEPAQTVRVNQVSRGGKHRVSGCGGHQRIECNGDEVFVTGSSNTVVITGRCTGLKVSGLQNVIKVDEVGVIRVSGMDNKITYRGDPEPKIIQTGMGNDIGRALLGPCGLAGSLQALQDQILGKTKEIAETERETAAIKAQIDETMREVAAIFQTPPAMIQRHPPDFGGAHNCLSI